MYVGPENEIDLLYTVGPKETYMDTSLAIKEELVGQGRKRGSIQVPENHDLARKKASIPSDSAMDEQSKECGGGGLCNSFIS